MTGGFSQEGAVDIHSLEVGDFIKESDDSSGMWWEIIETGNDEHGRTVSVLPVREKHLYSAPLVAHQEQLCKVERHLRIPNEAVRHIWKQSNKEN